MITIIDYKSGNLKSISNGFKKIGADYQITDDKEIIADLAVYSELDNFASLLEARNIPYQLKENKSIFDTWCETKYQRIGRMAKSQTGMGNLVCGC